MRLSQGGKSAGRRLFIRVPGVLTALANSAQGPSRCPGQRAGRGRSYWHPGGRGELAMPKMPNGGPELALTFDDVLLKPGLSEVMPSEVDIRTRITRDIPLNIPIIASAMDTVTEANMAIAMAQAGGIGVIHRNLEPDLQAEQVRRVKRFESGMVVNPLTIAPRRQADRGARPDEGARHFRHSGGRRRRQWPRRQAGRHPDQPRRAFRDRPRAARLRADDQGPAGHGDRGRVARGGEAAPAPAPHREAAGGRRQVSLRRPDHREGHREGGRQSERLQGRAGAVCASRPRPRSATRASRAPRG